MRASQPADPAVVSRDASTGGLPRRRGLVLLAASLGFAVIQLDVSVVNVAIKPIGASLSGGIAGLQWVVDAYTVAFAALILSAGALGDRSGARRVYLTGFGLFTAASVGCGLAPSLGVLIAGRCVQGVGAAALGACSLVLLHHAYPEPAERVRAVGLWAAGGSAALSAGPLVGGLLIAALGWRSIFFINVPVGLVGMWLTARFAAETPRARDRGMDLWGQLSAVVTLVALAAATINAGSRGFTDPLVLTGLLLAVLTGGAFTQLQRRRAQAMLPPSLFRSPTFSAAITIGLLVNIAFYGLIFVFSLFFQRQQQLSPLATGLAFAPVLIAVMISNIVAGRVVRLLGTRRTIAAGGVLMAVGCLTMLGASGETPSTELVARLSLVGLGIGLLVPAMTSALLSSVPRTWSGVASGSLTALRQTGSVLGVALFGSLLARAGLVPGLHLATIVATGLFLAVTALSALTSPDRAAS